MKNLIYLIVFVSFYGCGPKMYSYSFSMEEAKKDNHLHYDDDTISVVFNIFPKGFKMIYYNKTKSDIRLNWDEMKIQENGIEKEIIHVKREKGRLISFQPPSSISPKQRHEDFIVFEEGVTYAAGPEKGILQIADIIPLKVNDSTKQIVRGLKGQRISVHIPVKVSNITYPKTFTIVFGDIKVRRMVSGTDILAGAVSF